MLVEDDKSLREIYSIRLVAEGYDIVSAGDGEEALALAVQHKPDLIIADVMMPKISGFDMLDILRSQPETNKIKVIMMTALSSDDQRRRGESLGAERYLVKSQVGIEDVVATVHEVLGDEPNSNAQANLDTVAAMPAVEAAMAEQQKASDTNANSTDSNFDAIKTTTTTTIEPGDPSIPAPSSADFSTTPAQVIPDNPAPETPEAPAAPTGTANETPYASPDANNGPTGPASPTPNL